MLHAKFYVCSQFGRLNPLSFVAYGIKGKNLSWFESYLTGQKQYINFEISDNNGKTDLICSVPQGSILGPLLLIIYINDLCLVSDILKPIMFPDDTNLFFFE